MEHEVELAQLRARVAHLESLVERLTGDQPDVRREPGRAREAGVDRRRMLRHGLGLSAAAVAGVGALDALGSAAAAGTGDPVLVGQSVSPAQPADPPTRIFNASDQTHAPVLLHVDNTTDIHPSFPDDTKAAIFATADGHDTDPKHLAGVVGISNFGTGVDGRSDGYRGVAGTSAFATGVAGESTHGTGVSAISQSGPGLTAASDSARGIVATSSSGEAVHATSQTNIGVVGDGAFGVVGNGRSSGGGPGGTGVGASGHIGVLSQGSEIGVDAHSDEGTALRATSTDGPAVDATSTNGAGLVVTSGSGDAIEATSDSGTAVRVLASNGDGLDVVAPAGYAIHAHSEHDDASIWGIAPNGIGVLGTSTKNWGVAGQGRIGMWGDGDEVGVIGSSARGTGIKATSTDGTAVEATATSGTAVDATATSGAAIVARSVESEAIHAESTSSIGVDGIGAIGVCGTGRNLQDHEGVGVMGTGSIGVWTEGKEVGVNASSAQGTAVVAGSTSGIGLKATSKQGLGASFQGDRAAIRLVPRATPGPPTSGDHQRGEIVVDHRGLVWVCTAAGAPGTWKQLAFV